MSAPSNIRLRVPGALRYRNVAVRAVAEASQLTRAEADSAPAPVRHGDTHGAIDLRDRFDADLVSAFSEIFNNIAIHAYGGAARGDIAIDIWLRPGSITIELADTGRSFDLASVPAPALESLPESGMGIHIAKALVDEVDYRPGPPNVWRLTKHTHQRLQSRDGSTAAPPAEPR